MASTILACRPTHDWSRMKDFFEGVPMLYRALTVLSFVVIIAMFVIASMPFMADWKPLVFLGVLVGEWGVMFFPRFGDYRRKKQEDPEYEMPPGLPYPYVT